MFHSISCDSYTSQVQTDPAFVIQTLSQMYAKITTRLFSNDITAQKLLIHQKHVTKVLQLSEEKAKLKILIPDNITPGKKPNGSLI